MSNLLIYSVVGAGLAISTVGGAFVGNAALKYFKPKVEYIFGIHYNEHFSFKIRAVLGLAFMFISIFFGAMSGSIIYPILMMSAFREIPTTILCLKICGVGALYGVLGGLAGAAVAIDRLDNKIGLALHALMERILSRRPLLYGA